MAIDAAGRRRLAAKPYIDAFDRVKKCRSGWLASFPEEVARQRSDKRFT